MCKHLLSILRKIFLICIKNCLKNSGNQTIIKHFMFATPNCGISIRRVFATVYCIMRYFAFYIRYLTRYSFTIRILVDGERGHTLAFNDLNNICVKRAETTRNHTTHSNATLKNSLIPFRTQYCSPLFKNVLMT